MVLRKTLLIFLLIYIAGCSVIGYTRYEREKPAGVPEEQISKEEEAREYIVREYYLFPDEWWLDYPYFRWSIGFYLWEPYWWYPYYSIRCPGCYLFDPFIIKEPRRFEGKEKNPPPFNLKSGEEKGIRNLRR